MAEKIKVTPEVCSYTDEEHNRLTMEIALPGVKKEDIKLKMHNDSVYLSAARDDVEYVTAYSFCCPVVPGKAEAKYENGLLRINAPFQDVMEDAVSVSIN
jgi:HSP20 family molecular chaperone IbpA